jgi:hypothetical protein
MMALTLGTMQQKSAEDTAYDSPFGYFAPAWSLPGAVTAELTFARTIVAGLPVHDTPRIAQRCPGKK